MTWILFYRRLVGSTLLSLCISIGVCWVYALAPTLEEPKRGARDTPQTLWFATSLQEGGSHKKKGTIDYHWSNSLNLRGDVNRLICERDLLIFSLSFFLLPPFLFHCTFLYIFGGRQQEEKGFPAAASSQRVLLWQIFIVCAYIFTWVLQSAGGCFNGSLLFLLTFLFFFFFQRGLLFGVGSGYYWSVRWPPPMIITQSSSIPLVWLFCCRCQCNGTAHSGRRGE